MNRGVKILEKKSQYRMSHFLGARSLTTLWILQPIQMLYFVFSKTSHCLCIITGQSKRSLGESIHTVVREQAPEMRHPVCESPPRMRPGSLIHIMLNTMLNKWRWSDEVNSLLLNYISFRQSAHCIIPAKLSSIWIGLPGRIGVED